MHMDIQHLVIPIILDMDMLDTHKRATPSYPGGGEGYYGHAGGGSLVLMMEAPKAIIQ